MKANKGLKIGKDFKTRDIIPVTVSRAKIRAFIYECIINHGVITNIDKNSVNVVMDRFNLMTKDRIKIKGMINIILNRDNKNLPPIKHIHFRDQSEKKDKQETDWVFSSISVLPT